VAVAVEHGAARDADRVRSPTFLLLLLPVAVSGLLTPALQHGNRPYTQNFLTAADNTIAIVFFAIPVLGAAVLGLRPGHRSGWLLLAGGVATAAGLLAHAIAVRCLLVGSGPRWVGEPAAWLATWLLVPGLGVLPFALAAWPDGWIRNRWLHRLGVAAAVALAALAAAQAIAPDTLDGVARESRIDNPLGARALEGFLGPVSTAAALVLGLFTISVVVDGAVRAVRSRGVGRKWLIAVGAGVLTAEVAAGSGTLGDAGQIVAIAGTVLGAGLVVIAGAYQIRRVEQAERARAAVVAEREDERRRLRRELHDGVGPLLAALRLEIDEIERTDRTSRARGLVDDALGEIRRISRDLGPAGLEEFGLLGALRLQIARLDPGGSLIELEASATLPPLSAAVETAVLRIAGEAMTNVVRHSGAASCRVTLRTDPTEGLSLSVSDDGTGFEQANAGIGLASMQARATELGGRCTVTSRPDQGTRVDVRLPVTGPFS
jgi:signal transduction histidine kinase